MFGTENLLRSESYDDWLSKVRGDWRELHNVPELLRDERMYMTALAIDGEAFQYFPDEYFDDSFYPKAVATHGRALHFVPEASKTRELCLMAARRRTAIAYIPKQFLNRQMITEVVKHNPTEIRNVPEGAIDTALLAEYVSTGRAYDLYELCNTWNVLLRNVGFVVIASGLDNVNKLPGYAMTKEIFAVADKAFSLGESKVLWQRSRTRHSPNYLEAKEPAVQLRRLKTDPEACQRYHVHLFLQAWAVFWDEEFLKRMVNRGDSRIIASVPEDLLTEAVCYAAVAELGGSLCYVPESLRTLPVCLEATRKDIRAMDFVPGLLQNQVREYLQENRWNPGQESGMR